MTRFFHKLVIYGIVFLGVAGAAWAEAPLKSERPLLRGAPDVVVSDTVLEARPKPRQIIRASASRFTLAEILSKHGTSGKTAAVLIDVETGDVLDAYRGAVPMPPASVTKVLTTLYALETLGGDYSYTTTVYGTGALIGGTLEGDLVLVGSGDPALDSDELAELAEQIRARGVRDITGRFLYYDRALPHLREIDDGQPVHAAYNPGVSGLNLNFNRVFLEWSKEGELSLEARAERNSPSVRVVSVQKAQGNVPVYQYDTRGGADHWSIAENALKRAGGTWLPVRDPAPYAAEVFRTLAGQKGIRLPRGEVTETLPDGSELARVERRPLKLVTRGMLHFSTNLTAEVIGMTASTNRGSFNGLDGSAALMEDWVEAAYAVDGIEFRDHSGLGDWNRIAALDMAEIMVRTAREGSLDGLLRRHFVGGDKGKEPALAGAEVRAKTGTLNFVRGLSGHITGPRGRKLAFAIFTADLAARAVADGTQSFPKGARTFNRKAVNLEQVILRNWLRGFAR